MTEESTARIEESADEAENTDGGSEESSEAEAQPEGE